MAKTKQFHNLKETMKYDSELPDETEAAGYENIDDFFDGFEAVEKREMLVDKLTAISDSSIEAKSIKKENKKSIEEYKARKKTEMMGKYKNMMKNARISNHGSTGTDGILDSPETVLEYLVEYCLYCETHTKPKMTAKGIIYEEISPLPKTMESFATFIGVTVQYLRRILSLPQYANAKGIIKQTFAGSTIEMGASGEMDQRLAQFLLQTAYGYQLTKQVDVNVNATMKIEELANQAAKGVLNKEAQNVIEDVEFIELAEDGDEEDE